MYFLQSILNVSVIVISKTADNSNNMWKCSRMKKYICIEPNTYKQKKASRKPFYKVGIFILYIMNLQIVLLALTATMLFSCNQG